MAPEPAPGDGADARTFDLIVVGAGSGNALVGPEFAHWSVALIDDGERFGGTSLNAASIPSKMFAHVADVAADAGAGSRLGLSATVDPVDWARVRDRIFGRTDAISDAGLLFRHATSPNVTVFRETFGFEDQHMLMSASGVRLHSDRIVVAAGSRPRPLLASYDPDPAILDSDDVMRIESLPESLVIVGGGPVAVEFAHIFSSFGVDVTIVTRSERLLTRLDAAVSERFTESASQRWRVLTEELVEAIDRGGDLLVVTLESGRQLETELVLVAQGRIPNTDTLAAAAAGFDLYSDGRLVVDSQQRMLSRGAPVTGLYALGDISSATKLKHVANHEARVVAHNILHPDAPTGGDPGPIPAAIFSRPQIAHFGLTAADALAEGIDAVAVTQDYRHTAYGWATEDETGFCTIVVERGSGELLGAHIIGPEASILIQPLVLAASFGMTVRGLARGQYWPHPAASEVVENALLKAEEAL
ncbi:MAG TPA: mycothione reductase [Diaminobutyricibacter sp.]